MARLVQILAVLGGLLAGVLAGAAAPSPSVLVSGGSMMDGSYFADSVLSALRTHYAGVKRVVLVLHATHPDERDRMEARLRQAFRHLGGIEAESLHHRDEPGQRRLLAEAEAFFVGGGETFVLLAELYRTGQLPILRERVAAGVPYGGTSAGANVAGLWIGTTNDFPVAEIPSRIALGLLPVTINPHHPLPTAPADYAGRAGKIGFYLKFNPTDRVLALADRSVVRLHAGRASLEAGAGWLYGATGVRALVPGEAIPELAPKS